MKFSHFMFAMVINLVWGFNFLATKLTIDEIPPIFSAALRFIIILIFLFPFLKILPGRMKPLLITSAVMGIFHFGAFYVGLAMSDDISVVAVASLLSLPSATILAIIILGEKIGWKRGTGILAAFGGVVVLGYDPRAFSYIDGLMVVGVSALAMGVASIFMRQLQGVPTLVLQAWIALVGSPILLAASFVFETNQFEALANASWVALGCILYSAVLSSIVGHGGVYYLLQRYPVTVITPLTLLSQVVAVIASVVLLNEVLTSQMLVGSILTFVGVLIISLRNTKVSQSQSRARAELGSERS
jgi:O-acetylserine/cysteine efflux transporter